MLQNFFIKFGLAIRSKTVWTIVALFVFNGLTSVKDTVPPEFQNFVNVALTLLGIYFRMNPNEKLNTTIGALTEAKE